MLAQLPSLEKITQQRQFFQTGETRNIEFRLSQLKRLKQLILKNQDAIALALKADLGKPQFEAMGAEILLCVEELNLTIKNLKNWAKPQRVSAPLSQFPSSARVICEPLGVVLIIGAWNYPFQLVIAPLIGAIAAGNCAILKPSELAANTSKLIADLIAKTFDPKLIAVVEGGKETTQALLAEKFDHIFFTGSHRVGKIIMEAAAKHLTPVTLELGGKNPCIIEPDTPVELTAKRIAWGKFINAGQTCIAPDYLLVHNSIKDELCQALVGAIRELYGENPAKSPDYARIINDFHFERLRALLNEGKIAVGGETNAEEHYIAPTVLDGVNWNSEIMEEEIFGPILPLIEYSNLEEAIAEINARPKPLALYLFSKSKTTQQRVLNSTSSGGVCLNDTIVHFISPELPFGGVGESGMGAYHGKLTFDTFSHKKGVLKRSFLLDLKLRYPPYGGKVKLLKWLFK
ncbi:MAG: aldehyde dehydrogenase [Cyanobacteriota bacterium]|nr:aldehyde dehydrogenase [Cyanobacteriota bacterium]